MLEGLDRVEWQTLTHAYGEASDVSELLKGLASDDKAVREASLGQLYTNIYHQGTVYQASAYAVPFLIELLTVEFVQDKEGILVLLAHLATGNSYLRQHMHLEFFQKVIKEIIPESDFPNKLAEEIFWVEKTHAAVREGLNLYLSLLEHEDCTIRYSVAYTLACFREDGDQSIPALLSRLKREGDQLVKASILLSLGKLIEHISSSIYALFKRYVMAGETLLVRVAASQAFVDMVPTDPPLVAIEVLLDAARNREALLDAYQKLPWAFDTIGVLASLQGDAAAFAMTHLAALLDSLDHYRANDGASTLLHLVFRGVKVDKQTEVTALTPEQRWALSVIVNSDRVWEQGIGGSAMRRRRLETSEGDTELFETIIYTTLRALSDFGLPDNRKDLRAFLQMEAREGDVKQFITKGKMTPLDGLLLLTPESVREEFIRGLSRHFGGSEQEEE